MRAAVAASAKLNPGDPLAAAALAQRYFELAMAKGDPRYVGYADAVIKPFSAASSPVNASAAANSAPLLAVRGQLAQYRHGFATAMADFAAALKVDPQFASAHAWRGAIFLVQADYAGAQSECDALKRLGRATLNAGCQALVQAYSGQLATAAATLQQALQGAPDTDNRLWLLTRLGEVAAWRGQVAQAEAHYRQALALGVDDGYLLAAWGDFLLDNNRPADVVKALASWEASDGLLLRLALAETALKLPAAKAHVQALDDRFAAARQRGDTTHQAEEARFWLHLRNDPVAALKLATDNYRVQREPRDARIVLEAAIAAQQAEAAQPVREWLQRSGFEDARLRTMSASLFGVKP